MKQLGPLSVVLLLGAGSLSAQSLGDTAIDETMTVCLFGAADVGAVPQQLADIGWQSVTVPSDEAVLAHRAAYLPDSVAGDTDASRIKPAWDETAATDVLPETLLFDQTTGSLAVVQIQAGEDQASVTCRIVASRALSGPDVAPLITQLREMEAPAIASLGVQQEEVDGGRRAAAVFVMDSERIEAAIGDAFPFVSVIMARSEIGQMEE